MKSYFYKQVDNSPLILFRILFGFIMFYHGIKVLVTGSVKHDFVDPRIAFNFIGFDFLQVFLGEPMYVVYSLTTISSLCIAIGFRYRISIILFTVSWAITYFITKCHYDNHNYLILLVGFLMCFMPANTWRSLDVKTGLVKSKLSVSNFYIFTFKLLIGIVYFYAAIAKIYPDWLNAIPIERWFSHNDYTRWLWNDQFAEKLKIFFSQTEVHYFFSYAGILFDLLIVPAFLWKKTRTIALIAAIGFHISNAFHFQIGIFPLFAMSLFVFFYPSETIRSIFFKNKPKWEVIEGSLPNRAIVYLLSIFLVIQAIIPLHHHIIPGDVLWTDQGHRHSWRMMLRAKAAECAVFVIHPNNETYEKVDLDNHLMSCQIPYLAYHVDFHWQFANYIEEIYCDKWDVEDVQVSMHTLIGVNGREKSLFTDKQYDITSWKWNYFKRPPWILEKPF